MKVTLTFVPPGGGEADYSLDFDLPGVPQPGDYIRIVRPKESPYTCDFIVRRTWWLLNYPNDALYGNADTAVTGRTEGLMVECEFALSSMSSESHKQAFEMYSTRGKPGKKFEDTAF
jgi:hypothetical protein